MEKYFIEFLNIYFWIYLLHSLCHFLYYIYNEDFRENHLKYTHSIPKLFKIIGFILFIMSIKMYVDI